MIENNFSLYEGGIKDTKPSKDINLNDFLNLLKIDSPLLEQIRKCDDKIKRDILKQKLIYVTFAGIFQKRGKDNLIKSSGLACLDVDDVEDIDKLKEDIIRNKYTYCLFISPSGKGLKLIVKIPEVKNNEEYKKYWLSISNHYKKIKVDEGTKDISRACYLSYDKNPYVNLDSEIYTDKVEEIKPVISGKQKSANPKQKKYSIPSKIDSEDFLDKLKSHISMEEILSHFGVDTSINPTICPFHSCSQRCFSFNGDVCNCFDTDCGQGYNIFSFVKKIKNINSADAIKWLSDFAGLQKEFEQSKQVFILKTTEPKGWALSINIKKFAERKGWLKCPKCNNDFIFIETHGYYKCSNCKIQGGLKKFVELNMKKKRESRSPPTPNNLSPDKSKGGNRSYNEGRGKDV